MSYATILGQVAHRGGISSLCRCKVCSKNFIAGGNHYWHNHFYCCIECGHRATECSECGGNRNYCECGKESYE